MNFKFEVQIFHSLHLAVLNQNSVWKQKNYGDFKSNFGERITEQGNECGTHKKWKQNNTIYIAREM